MYEDRLETIKAVCEKLKNQPRKPKTVKSKHQPVTSNSKIKIHKIPSWCIDRIPVGSRIIREDGDYHWVSVVGQLVKIYGRDYLDGNLGNSPFLYVCYVMIRIRIILMKSVKLIPILKNRIYVQHA